MSTIPQIQTHQQGISNVGSLTRDDIMRMPKSYSVSSNGHETDTYEPQSKNTFKKALIGTALLAAAIVGLKHCSFMKIDGEATTFMQKFIKKPINKLGELIELPFVKIKNFLSKKADNIEDVTEDIIPPVQPENSQKLSSKIWLYIKNTCHHPIETIKHPKITWNAFFGKS